ncbi:MAG: threonylcarbamoyl-AMP synthase, partial [Bacteroidetes bacterium]
MAEIGTNIFTCKMLLEQNQLIGFPTETVYGLAGNALSIDAVTKIFETKNRPTFDPLICHAFDVENIKKYVISIPQMAYDLLSSFAPGPITVLLQRKKNIPDLVTSGLEHVAFRIPNHPLALDLLKNISFPLAAPSANPFGYISPTSAVHVQKQLGNFIPYILDGGNCSVGIESTIIGFKDNKAQIYRLGGLELNAIEHITGKAEIHLSSSKPAAPGMLESHYAPRKKMYVGDIDLLIKKHKNDNFGILSFSKKYNFKNNLVLSPTQNESEAAQ